MISALFLNSLTTNLKTYEQAKKLFNPGNTQSSYEESSKEKHKTLFWYMFPFHLVQYANTEFMS